LVFFFFFIFSILDLTHSQICLLGWWGQTVGTPENLIEGLSKYVDIGVTHFILHFIGLDEKALQLFDSKVIQKL
jgi:hypothetical protein